MVKHASCYFIFVFSRGCCESWVIDRRQERLVNFGLQQPEAACMTRRTALSIPRSRRSMLHARWWESASSNDKDPDTTSLITPQMEREVMSSARATMDTNTVNRALTSLIDESDSNGNLRDLVTRRRGAVSSQTASRVESSRDDQQGNNVWTAQQVALASGVSVLVLSPGRNFHSITVNLLARE